MHRYLIPLLLVAIGLAFTPSENVADQPAASIDDDIVKHLDSLRGELIDVNQDIWTYSEVVLEEHRSSKRLVEVLKKAGVVHGKAPIKILGNGELKSALTVHAHKFSKSAQEKITKAGGKFEVLQ